MAADRFETACAIAGVVAQGGVYTATVRTLPRQDVVDLLWSALSAGRILGIEIDVHTSEPVSHGEDHPMVTVEIRGRANAAEA